jgi:geranylgeranyl diphosphate synthase type II
MNPKMNNFDLESYLALRRKEVNQALEKILGSLSDSSLILNAMRHSLMAGGKRVRPTLCLAAAEAVGHNASHVIRAACAIEMIHTYSLIHDDLPALDDDVLRRGKPTCHVAFDEATAILAGDALLTLAFEVLTSIELTQKNKALEWLHIVNAIAAAAGYKGMIEGQLRDIAAEGSLLDVKDLQDMHTLKTGALIEVSIRTGAILGGGSPEQIEKLQVFAKNIGLAFQVTDDILNVEGDPAVMGKGVGTDHIREKNTYPSLLGLGKSKEYAKELVNNALQAIDYFDNKSDPLRAIAHYILVRKR